VKGINNIYHNRAELANDEFMPVQDMILENFVILKKNPDYRPEIE
jgi:26S proteasome regulatory subunit N1